MAGSWTVFLDGPARVVVLEAGRVLEDGPHDELVAAGGPYARLWAAWSVPSRRRSPGHRTGGGSALDQHQGSRSAPGLSISTRKVSTDA